MKQQNHPALLSRRTFLKGLGAVGAVGALAACGGNAGSSAASGAGATAGGSPITDYINYDTANHEVEIWNFFYSQNAVDHEVAANCIDGLVHYNNFGKLIPGIAESWESNEDATVWTFHLRQGVKWVNAAGEEMADLTSEDFLVGLEWVLNQLKNEASCTSMPNQNVKGAAEYYNYTKELAASDPDACAALTYEDMIAHGVGISAPDDYTLVYTCLAPCPYFDTVASSAAFYPAAPALIEQLGIDGFRGCRPDTMWYCGPYLIDEFIQGNSKHFVQNPLYWDDSVSRFNSVTTVIIQDSTMGLTLYNSGSLDEIELNEGDLSTITEDPNHQHHNYICEKRPRRYSYQIHLNFQKNLENGSPDDNWNKAVANRAFRQCIARGLDLTSFFSRYNMINPLRCENDFYSMQGACFCTDGTDYVELVRKKMWYANEQYDGETMIRTRGQDIAPLKAQAMEELSAIGVTFPVEVDYYVMSGDQNALDNATVLRQCFLNSLGEDMINFQIKTYVTSYNQEVRNTQIQSFQINGWGGDFGDPLTYLGQEVLGDDNAYYACYYSNAHKVEQAGWADWQSELKTAFETFTSMVNKAVAIVDIDQRYEAFAEAEAFLLDEALSVPCYYYVAWCLTHANEYSKVNAMYGVCNSRFLNWETRTEPYTTAEYEAFAAAYAAEA